MDFGDRWQQIVDDAIDRIDAGDLSGAGQELAGFLEEIAEESGGEPGKAIRAIAAMGPGLVLAAVPSPDPPPAQQPKRKWWGGRSSTPPAAQSGARLAMVRAALESEVGDPVRAVLAKRARSLASIAELTLAVDELTRRAGR